MDKKELEVQLATEAAVLVQRRTDFDAARAEYLRASKRDCHRSEGSGAQDARHEALLETFRNDERMAEAALNNQQRVVAELAEKFAKN
ncbi:hypothetical protein [Serratia proteamaculans]|uniref:hypothetical protein n=1 Tax=Serratia proteamaculans TaxID=28151 RepID=UPI003CF79237